MHRQLLLIDDDISARRGIAIYLESCGFQILQEGSGKAGLEHFKKRRPDVVLTDLRTADIDGFAILKFVQENAPEIPVIVISETVVVEEVINALRLGAADYLVKPIVDMEDLIHSIARALERSELILKTEIYRQELEQANRELKEHVRILERDQKAGRSVQRKLLPEVPASFGSFTVDFKLIPTLYLSGDFVDFGLVSDRYMAFYLTDVSGHGAASAFVTVWLKQLVRRYFRERKVFRDAQSFKSDAARLTALINNEVINSGVGCHMTCFVGVIDMVTREMRYVFGGHLPFPILVTDQGCEYLTGKGKPVGIFPNASWEVNSRVLPEKFSLTVFSDGILEILLPGSDLIAKEDFLLSIVRDHSSSVEALIASFGINENDVLPDDVTILQIKSERVE